MLLTSVQRLGNSFAVSVPTLNGKTYTLEFKDSLSDPVWTSGAADLGDGITQTLVDANATGSRRFYRVRQSD